MNASSNLHEVLCFLFQVRQFKVQTAPLHGRCTRPVSGPSQCASTHPSAAAALPTPTAFHSSPAERKRIGVCLWSEGGRGDHSKSPLFWSTNLQQGREGRRGVSSQFHSGPPLLPPSHSHSPPQISIAFQFMKNASKYLKFTLLPIPGVPKISYSAENA